MRPATRLAVVALLLTLPAPALAGAPFPEILPLPDGFQPEGITVGEGATFYVGSIPSGAVYRGDLRTGTGSVLVPPGGAPAIGLKADHRGRLFVAAGPTGGASVYDARTGDLIAFYDLAVASDSFVNDVVVTEGAAWFTDSFNPVLYRLPLGPGGALPPAGAVEIVPVTGDYVHESGRFNLNGIDATPDGGTLVVVQSEAGRLFTVDPATGIADEIELGGDSVTFGDGILLDGKRLFVVRNFQNRVAVVGLSADLGSGEIVRHLTHPALDVPTTIAEHGKRLYTVNARFTTPPAPDSHFEVVQLRKP